MSNLSNKIEAHDRSILEVLDNKKYTVDYFQREYNWEERHVEQLISDFCTAFLNEYHPNHKRVEVDNYNSYYLGPFVVCEKDGKRIIIDGQQRLTSITLFLIYLNNLQKDLGYSEIIDSLIFSMKFGEKSYNIQVEERLHCLEALFLNGEYQTKDDDDESTINMAARYQTILQAFPDEIKNSALPYFIDWLKYKVVLVEIVAYSDENAYIIFETMNDRGLNLTSAEMLKGFILSKVEDKNKREKANEYWKQAMQKLHRYEKDEEQRFFQTWFRAQYADTIRPGRAGSKNEDFEKVGTRFHSWVRDNLNKTKLNSKDPESFEEFIFIRMKFFLDAYLTILDAELNLKPSLEHVYYISRWGIANSLSYPLMIAPLRENDSKEVVEEKINTVARYIETFVVLRSVNFKKFASSSIRYTMYALVKEIRNTSIDELKKILKKKIVDMDESFDGMLNFRMHGQNGVFVKFLLSRITSFIELKSGYHTSFANYYSKIDGKPYEIEHIWANTFDNHRDDFEQESDFQDFRNRIGGLLLLPRGTNQSFGSKPYEQKLEHYIKNNLLAQSLCSLTYQNNPNFLSMVNELNLPFKPHPKFTKKDLEERQELYKSITEKIYSTTFFQ